ncbi:MAG: hypothetical protein ACPLKZ_01060 [Candidatus Bathyarchaeales archaeon]
MKLTCKRYLSLITCLALLSLLVPLGFAVNSNEAAEAVNQAAADLGSAFAAVAEAEQAGANISALMAKLDVAGVFLTQAQSALRTGDYENAVSFAHACSDAIEGMVADAAHLKLTTEKAQADSFLLATIGSSVGLVLLCVFGFMGWKLLKKWYLSRLMDMKPEIRDVAE